MNKTTYIILALVILVIIGGITLSQRSGQESGPSGEVTIPENETLPPITVPENEIPFPQPIEPPIKEDETTEQKEKEHSVINTDSGYSPDSITIKKGETITWKNESLQPTWPASALHPTHEIYPTKGGCIASTFDACKGIEKGESWSFTFNILGTWKYHDHLNPSHFGAIIVK